MRRAMRILVVAVAAVTSLGLVAPGPVAAAGVGGAPADTPGVRAGAGDDAVARQAVPSVRQLRRVLPGMAAAGALLIDHPAVPNTLCATLERGPVPQRATVRRYSLSAGVVVVTVRAYADAATAAQALRSYRVDLGAFCRGRPAGDPDGARWSVRRAKVALRGFGDQRFGRRVIRRAGGNLLTVGLHGGYRVGRYLVLYESYEPVTGGDRPTGLPAQTRAILAAVRDRAGRLPA